MNCADLSPLNSNGLISKFLWGWRRCRSCHHVRTYSWYQGFSNCFHCRPLSKIAVIDTASHMETWIYISGSPNVKDAREITLHVHIDLVYNSFGRTRWCGESLMLQNLMVRECYDHIQTCFQTCQVPAPLSIIELRQVFVLMLDAYRKGKVFRNINDVHYEFEIGRQFQRPYS